MKIKVSAFDRHGCELWSNDYGQGDYGDWKSVQEFRCSGEYHSLTAGTQAKGRVTIYRVYKHVPNKIFPEIVEDIYVGNNA